MDDFMFKEPGKSDRDSFPLGNGDIGITFWAEEEGRICFYISKNDAFSEDLRLLKIGKVIISSDKKNQFISYRLDIEKGYATAYYNDLTYRIWVDANNPCIRIEADSPDKALLTVKSEVWRTKDYTPDYETPEGKIAYRDFAGQDPVNQKVTVSKDIISQKYSDAVIWYHRNNRSCYIKALEHQDIPELEGLYSDPLLYRTFGACIRVDNGEKTDELSMRTTGSKKHDVTIGVYCSICENEEDFIKKLYECSSSPSDFNAHCDWWSKFNDRSYINLWGNDRAHEVSQGYKIQRYMTACNARGEYPIKFNGSIFTVQIPDDGHDMGPDYRRWGGPYWFQNTRLIYWTMLSSGDYEFMKPFFDMYIKSYEIAKAKTKSYFGLEGLYYPETMTPWSTFRNGDYGHSRNGSTPGIANNPYIRYYFSGMLELLVLMIEYYLHTEDMDFKNNVLSLFAKGIVDFYKNMYPEKDEKGKIIIYPSMALETWQDAKNPTDAVAGLRYVLEQLIELKAGNEHTLEEWVSFYHSIPEVPCFYAGGYTDSLKPSKIKPAYEYDMLGNVENPELYAVFPYRLYSFEKDNKNVGRETYFRRELRNNFGWTQDGIQAAVLGLDKEAEKFVYDKFSIWSNECRFRSYFGPNYDWVPDQDHGCSASIALEKMLIQCVDEKIYLFPAWPKEWNVKFKVHAYYNTVIEGEYIDGKPFKISVFPEERHKDIVICK